MKRLLLLIAALIGVAILAARKMPRRAEQPEAEEGTWELADSPQPT